MNFITHIDADGRPTVITIPQELSVDEIRAIVRSIGEPKHVEVTQLCTALNNLFDETLPTTVEGDNGDEVLRRARLLVDENVKWKSAVEGAMETMEHSSFREDGYCSGRTTFNERFERFVEEGEDYKEKADQLEDMQSAVDEAMEALRRVES